MRSSFRNLALFALMWVAPVTALAQTAPAGLGPSNPVPGGLTLVPGTVVVPGVGGSATTGTVPLAGTVGSTGTRDFNPGLSTAPETRPSRPEALYPPAYYPSVQPPMTLQSTLPQNVQPAPNGFGSVAVPNCPAGALAGAPNC